MGYHILCGDVSDTPQSTTHLDQPTYSLIEAVKSVGLETLSNGRLAFLPCTQVMLSSDALHTLPHEQIVVEILPDLAMNARVIEACERLRRRGYRIAISNLTKDDQRELLVPFADFLEVDWNDRGTEDYPRIAARASKPIKMVARKVNSRTALRKAEQAGFTLFQGEFFLHPEGVHLRQIPPNQASKLQLLRAVSAPVVDFALVESLIREDASLCYRLMRYINSPVLGLSTKVQCVFQALNLLGEQSLTRWIRTATALSIGQPKCSHLVLASLVRARFCELIASKVDHGDVDLFLVGMFSLMDAILETPMETLLDGLGFDPHAKAALLAMENGGGARLSPVCHLMVARENGDWERIADHAQRLNLSLQFVNRSYLEAMKWAHDVTKSGY